MRRITLASALALALFGAACQSGTGPARPLNDPPSAQETLPDDAGQLENPEEVVTPGGEPEVGDPDTTDVGEPSGGSS